MNKKHEGLVFWHDSEHLVGHRPGEEGPASPPPPTHPVTAHASCPWMARADGVSPPPSETSAASPCRSAKPMLSTCSIVFTASKSAESTAEKMSRKTITCSHYRGPTSSGNEINTKLSNWEACKVIFCYESTYITKK